MQYPNKSNSSSAPLCLLIWLLCSFALAVSGISCGLKTVLPGPSSSETLAMNPGERLAKAAGIEPRDQLFITLSHQTLVASESGFESTYESLWKLLHSLGVFQKIQTVGHSWLDESLFISRDKHTVLLIADSKAPIQEVAKDLTDLPTVLNDWRVKNQEFQLNYISNGTADLEMFTVINRDLDQSLAYTVPITFAILFWSFGSLVAALVPVLLAIVSLAASLGASALFSSVFYPVSATASQLVVLLVLALGVDYSLFIISRMREEVARGLDYRSAIAISVKTAGTAVLWSGLTVALSLFGLLLMNDTVLTSMAIVSIISVIITVVGVFFALPALLLILKEKIEYGQIWRDSSERGSSDFLVNLSINRPLIVLIIGLLFMAVMSSACLYLKLGTTVEPSTLPRSMQSAQAFDALASNFPELAGPGLSIIMSAPDLNEKEDAGELEPFFDALSATHIVRGPIKIDRSADSSVARYHFITAGSANDLSNQQLISELRNQLIPKELESRGVSAHLAGVLPFAVDDSIRYAARTPLVFAAVLALCFIFLLLAFRSIVVPVHAICLNLLSTTAAFGVLKIFFQSPGVIESFIPALLFSILFGLSMDYHVFLVSRIQELTLSGASTKTAVKLGLSATYRTITSAALIMVSVFAVIATLELPIMKQLGVGLAVAVFIDATVIRSILLPSSMLLLGGINWYLPSWLRWLPKLGSH